ncbi:phosphotransferase [Algoriphagus sp. SE2]|uniref:phosphotransferase n=1 Tax=Algoriphagus sp. SE2 TaxID=3141536 RepID=UPI0031CD6A4B
MINLELTTSIQEISKIPIWEFEEQVEASEPAGESNMNIVLRITTNKRSVILKQSKPYVRKYPQIKAPINRISVENAFYKAVNQNQILKNFSPKVLAFLPDEHLLVTEDLGKGSDFSEIYAGQRVLKKQEVQNLCDYLNALHELEVKSFPTNNTMKILNHEHIFWFPFLEVNGFDLDSIQHGLQDLSLKYKKNLALKKKIDQLGKQYLSQGDTLLHGDFYPGSWLKMGNEIKIIDPEFGFLGDPEFDLGVLFAHFELGQQSEELKSEFLQSYIQPLSPKLLDQYQGVEILRRLIGIAQLPLNLTLEQKEKLMNRAVELILE